MYNRGKYITGVIGNDEVAVVFPETIQHIQFQPMFKKILGAGFFNVVQNKDKPTILFVSCQGKSIGLAVKSRESLDGLLIARALGISGYTIP